MAVVGGNRPLDLFHLSQPVEVNLLFGQVDDRHDRVKLVGANE